jgi:hypothetical protein
MNDLQDRLDGIQRWFYGGEPGMDDLPLDGDLDAAPPGGAEELVPLAPLCSACAQALQQR